MIVWEGGIFEICKFLTLAGSIYGVVFMGGVVTLHDVEVVARAVGVGKVLVEITGIKFFPSGAVHFARGSDGLAVDQNGAAFVVFLVIVRSIKSGQGAAVVVTGEIF